MPTVDVLCFEIPGQKIKASAAGSLVNVLEKGSGKGNRWQPILTTRPIKGIVRKGGGGKIKTIGVNTALFTPPYRKRNRLMQKERGT